MEINQKLNKFAYLSTVIISIFSMLYLSSVIIASIVSGLTNFVENTISLIVYFVFVLIPLIVIGVIATKKIKASKTQTATKTIAYIWGCLTFVFLVVVLSANFKSGDYTIFLSKWVDYYKNHSLKDCLYNIIEVTNYAPAYNYILILISRIPMFDLHLIKYVSFLFSLFLAYIVCEIVAKLQNSEFNFALFATILILPCVLIEFSSWGQCDAIYAAFALTSFYFALNKKSKLSFLFIGLAFINKLQFLFIVPILFVMLIVKDDKGEHYLKWKDIWIPLVVYSINLIPVLAGRSLIDMLLVYVNQSAWDTRLAGHCPNVCMIFYEYFGVKEVNTTYKILMILQIVITLAVLVFYLVIIFKKSKNQLISSYDLAFWAFAFAFTMVFLMPKMLDRFYYIASLLAIIFMFAFKDKFSCILGFITTLFFSIILVDYIENLSFLLILSILLAVANFGFMIYMIIEKYVKPLKQNKEREYKQ